MAKKAKRFWNFKRSYSQDRSFLDWFGARSEPKVDEGLTHVEHFLGELVDEVGLRDGVTLDDLKTAWSSVVGENIANNSEPLEISNGVLRIRVSQPVIKFELKQHSGRILENIQSKIPEAKIKRIDILI